MYTIQTVPSDAARQGWGAQGWSAHSKMNREIAWVHRKKGRKIEPRAHSRNNVDWSDITMGPHSRPPERF